MIQTLSALVHARAKVGKTTLAATCPAPILAFDVEGGWKFLPIRKIDWDPRTQPPPIYDGSWDACIVTVRDWSTMTSAYSWLLQGQHTFRSIVVDSITEVQRRCKENIGGDLKIQEWGRLLTDMDRLIRGLRDLTLHPTNPVLVVIFIAETRLYNGRWKPSMQGQIVDALPYWCDIVGYLFTEPTLDANNQPTTNLRRRLLIGPNDAYEAGERVQGRLGYIVDEPNITDMYLRVFGLDGQTAAG